MSRPERTRSRGRGSYLAQIQFPLAFFALALLVVEASFGVCLARVSYSEKLTLFIASWMGALFVMVLLIVAFLTYKVPHHIMLQTQTQVTHDALAVVGRAADAIKTLSSPSAGKNADEVLAVLNQVEAILKGNG